MGKIDKIKSYSALSGPQLVMFTFAFDRKGGFMSIKTDVFLAAGFGGVAPNLLKIALLLTAGPVVVTDVTFILTYVFGLVILALLGIFTAWARLGR